MQTRIQMDEARYLAQNKKGEEQNLE